MDRLDAMRAFVQVVDSGSFTRAAAQLNLHKATVSQQVQQLEDRLGTRLLTRSTRSVLPTSEGWVYHQHARSLLEQVDAMEATLRSGGRAAAGRLRVDVPVTLGRLVFAPEVGRFLERHPRISLEMSCTDRNVDLVQEGLDCAVRGGRLPDSSLAARRVGGLRFVLCAAPHYIERHGLPATPQELVGHQQVGYLMASTGRLRPVTLQRDGQTQEVEVPARFITTDSAAVLTAALDGQGLAVVAEFVASQHLGSGALQRVLPAWCCPSMPLQLVTPSRRHRAARVQVFMDWAHQLLARRLGPHLEAA